MNSTIFVVDAGNKLTEMRPSDFATEADFQKLLADHPALLRLAADTSSDLLLVSQEYGVADQANGSSVWSIDHLFLTREGVPVLVEVKRSSDTRARREVVAQMLDYASHATAYGSGTEMASRFQRTATESGLDPDVRLSEFLGASDPEGFWRQVEANLRSGRIRMVFVADKISKEVQRIVEWLNEQLRSAEVLAIEIAQFTNPNGVRTLVPRLVGATERAQSAKAITPRLDPISVADWMQPIKDLHGDTIFEAANTVATRLQACGLTPRIGSSQKSIAFDLKDADGKDRGLFYLYRDGGYLEISIPNLRNFPGFGDEKTRLLVIQQFKAVVPGFKIPEKGIRSWPRVSLSVLTQQGVLDGFLQVVDDVATKAKLT
ncbi:hypothetical protein SAMN05444161_4726 [Rhizobiales bacterium GAS191]|nr:hypothetical protein SAMN05444161_4726 [Rhizobiales bacterium GAS191]